ncbi:thioesterase family protein [Paludibacteraceae bacterium OttesenSCG-928-F17]|nr:thioesterase family protein [Paludibacteraceae bacterium OttesenSCG-928-F17]
MTVGAEFTQQMVVTQEYTANALGSGFLPVFGTPALVAFMEGTAAAVLSDLSEDETSVGTLINIEHLKASKIGETITFTARITEIDRKRYVFQVEARDSSGEIVGKGTHERFVVNVDKFMSKLN